jgi:hypothetical protein
LQRFLHRSVARDTVRKHVLSLRAGAGRFGLFSAIFVMRISTPDKAGGLVRPRPPALHRLAGGQFGPDGKCLFCSFLWAHAKVELVEVRFIFGPEWGPFLFCSGTSMCGGSKNGATFLVQFRDLPSEGFCLRGVKVVFYRVFPTLPGRRSCGVRHTQLFVRFVGQSPRFAVPAAAWFLRCHTGRFVCVARRQVMCRSGTCCAWYEESEGRCHIVKAGAASSSRTVGCLRLAAKLTPHVTFSGFCHKWLPDICRPYWVLCFFFTQEQDDDLRFERTAACGWPR